MDIKNTKELEAAYPELVAEIRTAATSAERARIKDIEEIAIDGFDDAVNDAKFANPITASELAVKIISESKKQGKDFLAARKDDVNSGNVNATTNGASATSAAENGAAVNKYDAAIDSIFPKK